MATPVSIVALIAATGCLAKFLSLLANKTEPGLTPDMRQWLALAITGAVIGALFWTLADIHRALITRSETS